MPPHCDSMDGPVVAAARKALEARDVDLALAFVPESGEDEVKAAFDKVISAREAGGDAAEVADRHFFETVVRIHRAGEGAPFTGLKPAGLGHGPVVPVAERAIESGSAKELAALLTGKVEQELAARFREVRKRKAQADGDVEANRRYVQAALDLQVWANRLYECAAGGSH